MLLDRNFRYYGADCHYYYHTDCSNSGCDDICRCGTIENSEIDTIELDQIVKYIYDEINDESLSSKRDNKINSILGDICDQIDKYTINRILVKNKIWEKYNWEISINDGYYGEEITGIYLDGTLAIKIDSQIKEALCITDINKRVEYLLELEYGYLLPSMTNLKYRLEIIDRSLIQIPNDTHRNNVLNKNLEHYLEKSYSGIRGVLLEESGKYRLIDGYHRTSATNLDKILTIVGRK